jgi:2,3-bisphosphoglycerate-dependent phosphoglycerate mutase
MFRKTQLKEVVKQIVLVRHGESVWNQESKFTGWTNIPLTENGKKDAQKIALTLLANKIYPNIVFSSVLKRCTETSNIIRNKLIEETSLQYNLNDFPIHTSWRLNEKHYGTLEGIPRQYIRDTYGEKFTQMMRKTFSMKPPIIKDYNYKTEYPIYRNCYFEKIKNGESKENVLDRLLPYFENDIMYTLSENRLPLIVTHKHTARVLMKHLLKLNEEDFEYYDIPNKGIIVLYFDEDNKYLYSKVIETL